MCLNFLLAAVTLAAPPSPPRSDTANLQGKTSPQPAANRLVPPIVAAFAAARPDKAGRITLTVPVETASISDSEFQGKKGDLVLATPDPHVTIEEALKHPEERDRVEVRLTPDVVGRLKKQGVTDPAVHFKGRTVKATGKPTSTIYLCFPAVAVYTILVERIEDIEIVGDAVARPKRDDKKEVRL